MIRNLLYYASFLFLIFSIVHCTNDEAKKKKLPTKPRKSVNVQKFDADNAFQIIQKQIEFGPRTPNSEGHTKTKNWLVEQFKSLGSDEVMEQNFSASSATTNESFTGTNIIAQYNVKATDRIVLFAHWDTRSVAEKDKDEKKKMLPIDGADDGASGVAVLLEIARHLQKNPIELGVDLILFDAEDNGKTDSQTNEDVRTWCQGSQYWAQHLHRENYRPQFGILLDMVGAKDAQFTKERASMEFAPALMNKVWDLAHRMGKGKYFIKQETSEVLDDHSFVNAYAKIPTIDIINHPVDKTFGDHHHTHADNIDIIDKNTLAAVGQVMLAVIYNTNNGSFKISK